MGISPLATVYGQEDRVLYTSGSDSLFRIPAITCTHDGIVIALADYRYQHGMDVGFGYALDIMQRTSHDSGKTWNRACKVVSCTDSTYGKDILGFGDPAIVSDRKSNRQLILCVGDKEAKGFWQRGRLNIFRFESTDNGNHWRGENATTDFYEKNPDWKCMFIGSGCIFQSRVVRKSKYYRLYCSALIADFGNAVFYSDDFGRSWDILGDPTVSPCPQGDEAKTEELPDGTVILSSRTHGRYFNFYRYNDKSFTTGQWDKVSKSSDIVTKDNSTNGEIMGLEVVNTITNEKEWLYLQSVPYGPERSHVSIYYRTLPGMKDYSHITPEQFGSGWKLFEITDFPSAYSTLCLQKDKRIGFLYERKGADVNGFDIVYRSLSVEEITSGAYKVDF